MNTIERAFYKWGSFKEDMNYKDTNHNKLKETAEFFKTHYEERKFREFNTYRIHWNLEK